MKPEELYKLAKEQEGKDPESARVLYQEIIDNHDYSIFSDKANFALGKLTPIVLVTEVTLPATTRNIILAISIPLVIFPILGPFLAGNYLSFTQFIIFVYIVGLFPAIIAGLFFSVYTVWFITRINKKLFSGITTGLICGLISISGITFFQHYTGIPISNTALNNYFFLAELSCLSGAICGWISLGAIKLFSNRS